MRISRTAKHYSTNRDDGELRVVVCPKCRASDVTKTDELVPLAYDGYPLRLCRCNKCDAWFTFYREDGLREISEEEAKQGVNDGHLDVQEDGKEKYIVNVAEMRSAAKDMLAELSNIKAEGNLEGLAKFKEKYLSSARQEYFEKRLANMPRGRCVIFPTLDHDGEKYTGKVTYPADFRDQPRTLRYTA